MTRPPAGPPPVATSAVARRNNNDAVMTAYKTVAEAFQREDRRADLRAMLGSDMLVDRFLSVALHALSTNPDVLTRAEPLSIIQAVKDSASLGLEPTGLGGEGWILLYGDKAMFRPGWRGYLKRIRNSGKVQDVDVQVVYEGDDFDYGWNQNGGWFDHRPVKVPPIKEGDEAPPDVRGDYAYTYAYARMPSGFIELEVMTAAEVNYVAQTFSPSVKAGRQSPWDTSWPEMARKTVLRRLSKRLPQEAVDRLLIQDETLDALDDAEKAAERREFDTSIVRRRAITAARGEAVAAPTEDAGGVATATAAPEAEPTMEGAYEEGDAGFIPME